jgi:hypothetical protein
MRRRKLLMVGAVGLVVLALAAVGFMTMSKPTVQLTKANCKRIQPGMLPSEVAAILGGPGGDYRSLLIETVEIPNPSCWDRGTVFLVAGETPPEDDCDRPKGRHFPDKWLIWKSDEGTIRVDFSFGRVTDKEFFVVQTRERGTLGSLLGRARRQWRKWFP